MPLPKSASEFIQHLCKIYAMYRPMQLSRFSLFFSMAGNYANVVRHCSPSDEQHKVHNIKERRVSYLSIACINAYFKVMMQYLVTFNVLVDQVYSYVFSAMVPF